MKSMVVLFALCAVACGSYLPLAQPPHHPALVLDPHGRPLDTAEVINARALHLQAKALEGHYGHAAVVAPIAHSYIAPAYTSPLLAHASPLLAPSALGYGGYGHYLHKRSLGHYGYATPALVAAPSAVSHQSRVDVVSSPAVVSHAVAAPVLAHAAPVVAVARPAVSHQSRVDVRTSPAVIAHAAPYYSGHGYYNSAPLVNAW